MKQKEMQDTVEYHQLFASMSANFDVIKDLEKQKSNIGEKLVDTMPLIPANK
jgi:hypothetical protein